MAQTIVISKTSATYVGIEGTYGTTPSMTRCADGVWGTADISGLARDELKIEDERVRGFAHIAPAHGLRSSNSQIKLSSIFRADATQLQGASTSVPVTTPWLYQFILGLWGNTQVSGASGNYYVNKGSTVASTSGPTAITVATGHGSRFVKGQWIAVQTGASTQEYVQITNISTDTLTLWPSMVGTPTNGYVVTNGWNFAPAQYNTASLSFQHAKAVGSAVTAAQWTANGCNGDLTLDWSRGKMPMLGIDLKSATHTGPSTQSLGITAASTSMAVAPPSAPTAMTLFQTFATTTNTNYPLLGATIKFNGGMRFQEELSGVEGTTGWVRIPQRPFATGTLKFRFDPSMDTSTWDAQTPMELVLLTTIGSGLSQRAVGVQIPNLVIVGKPKAADEGGLLYHEAAFESLEDVNITSAANDMDFAPARLFTL